MSEIIEVNEGEKEHEEMTEEMEGEWSQVVAQSRARNVKEQAKTLPHGAGNAGKWKVAGRGRHPDRHHHKVADDGDDMTQMTQTTREPPTQLMPTTRGSRSQERDKKQGKLKKSWTPDD